MSWGGKRVAIVGGGLSGLSAGFDLHRAGVAFDLFEAQPRFGGYVKTSQRDGFIIENGADSWIANKPWLEELAHDLGIADEIVASPAVSPSTSILKRGKLTTLPSGLSLFVPSDLSATDASPLFSEETKRRFHEELAHPPAPLPEEQDESVASFVERHFGREVVDTLAAPLLAGVYGGDANGLSARAVIPGLVALEAKYSSLVRGAQLTRPVQASATGVFRTFLGGMSTVVDALVAQLPSASLHGDSCVMSAKQSDGSWSMQTSTGTREGYSHLILALPIPAVAQVLGIELPRMRYSSAATVALAYDSELSLPPGFGFLVASGEPCAILAATFVQQKWRDRVPVAKSLIRAFVSDPKLLAAPDGVMLLAAQDALRVVLGLEAEPMFAVIDRWPNSMPQYEVGHLQRVAEIRDFVARCGDVYLAGNSYDGVGMPDAVRTGRAAARAVMTAGIRD
ncbi:MAG TPA: protoporphyrinogen oxidase [Terriglobales bacterium]